MHDNVVAALKMEVTKEDVQGLMNVEMGPPKKKKKREESKEDHRSGANPTSASFNQENERLSHLLTSIKGNQMMMKQEYKNEL